MTIATSWRVTFSVTVNTQAEFEYGGSETSSTGTAMRTNAKFLIACGLHLLTLLVMLTRALINNNPLVALSAYTARGNTSSTSAQSKQCKTICQNQRDYLGKLPHGKISSWLGST
jgi:hypothetical protein